ncbi:MAG: BON domain-containing protein [Bdellovibrionota bacterium]
MNRKHAQEPFPPMRRDDDYYFGGPHTQREDWETRTWDNNAFDRREGMYEAGGRDFSERMRDAYSYGEAYGGRPMSPERVYRRERDMPRHRGGFVEGVKNFFGIGPKGYRRSDERIREDVCEALSRHPQVNAADIEVSVKDGHVVLVGTVESRWMKRLAEDAISYVPGVHDVHNELTIPRNTDDTGELNTRSKMRRIE